MSAPNSKTKFDGIAANLLGKFDKLRKQDPAPTSPISTPPIHSTTPTSSIFNNLSISFNKNRDNTKSEHLQHHEAPTSLVVIDDEEFDDPPLPDSPHDGEYKSLGTSVSANQVYSENLEKQLVHANGSVSDFNISHSSSEGILYFCDLSANIRNLPEIFLVLGISK